MRGDVNPIQEYMHGISTLTKSHYMMRPVSHVYDFRAVCFKLEKPQSVSSCFASEIPDCFSGMSFPIPVTPLIPFSGAASDIAEAASDPGMAVVEDDIDDATGNCML